MLIDHECLLLLGSVAEEILSHHSILVLWLISFFFAFFSLMHDSERHLAGSPGTALKSNFSLPFPIWFLSRSIVSFLFWWFLMRYRQRHPQTSAREKDFSFCTIENGNGNSIHAIATVEQERKSRLLHILFPWLKCAPQNDTLGDCSNENNHGSQWWTIR